MNTRGRRSVQPGRDEGLHDDPSTGEDVSINLAGREPDGIVDPADFEKVRDQVMDALSSFVDPKTGRKPDEMEEHLRGLGYLE